MTGCGELTDKPAQYAPGRAATSSDRLFASKTRRSAGATYLSAQRFDVDSPWYPGRRAGALVETAFASERDFEACTLPAQAVAILIGKTYMTTATRFLEPR